MNTVLASLLVDGVLLRREAIELGFDDESLTRAVRAGLLVRIRQGVYAERQEWSRLSLAQRHLLLAVGVGRLYGASITMSRATAVLLHNGPAWNLDLDAVDVMHPDASGRTQGRVRHHRGHRLPDDMRASSGVWVTSPTRTALEAAAQSRSVETGVVIVSDFLHRGLTSLEDLDFARHRLGQSPGTLLLRSVLSLADERLESVAEARCWYVLNRHGLPASVPQYPVRDRAGRLVARLDFAIPALGVFIEVDGRSKYDEHRRPGEGASDVVVRERRRENLVRELTGWEVVRLTWADLAHPNAIIDRIRAVSARRAMRPTGTDS